MTTRENKKGLPGLFRIMRREGLLQRDLAKLVGVSTKHLSVIGNCHANASYDLILSLSEVLNCSIDELSQEEALADA